MHEIEIPDTTSRNENDKKEKKEMFTYWNATRSILTLRIASSTFLEKSEFIPARKPNELAKLLFLSIEKVFRYNVLLFFPLLAFSPHIDSKYQRTKLSERNAGNTTQMIKYALNIEDLSSQDELKDFTLQNVKLRGLMNNYWFAATRKQLPPNFEEMSLCLVPMGKYCDDKINYEDDCIFTQVERFDHNQVHFEKKFPPVRGVTKMVDLTTTYFVRFIPNRITYRACFQALDSIKQHLLHCFFDDFEHEPEYCKRDNGRLVDNFEWYNEQIKTNEEQMTAIKNIVNCTAYPFPYVVFGPPGTGKTSCIVECIAQILKLKPDSRIMVTAQSNSACDEVGVRLLKYISSNKIFRFYSASLLNPENGETSDILRKTSNLRNKRNQYPTREEFRHFNVILVTLMSCSRMVQLDGEAMNRNFDYIFVDECAAATEPEAFVPIIGEFSKCDTPAATFNPRDVSPASWQRFPYYLLTWHIIQACCSFSIWN